MEKEEKKTVIHFAQIKKDLIAEEREALARKIAEALLRQTRADEDALRWNQI